MSQENADIESSDLDGQPIDAQASASSIALIEVGSDLAADRGPENAPDDAPDGAPDHPPDTATDSAPKSAPDRASSTLPDWMIAEIGQIGYFDPDYQAPANSKGSTYLAADRQYIYHDVFVFTARLQTRLAAVGAVERTLKTVLPKCLCNSAWIWYDEMSDHKKDLLNNSNISMWYEALEVRFRSTGTKLASAPGSPTKRNGNGKRKKGKAETLNYWQRRRGETDDEHQVRMRRAGT